MCFLGYGRLIGRDACPRPQWYPTEFGYIPEGFNTYLYNLYVTTPSAFNDITAATTANSLGNDDIPASNLPPNNNYGPPGTGLYYQVGVGYDFSPDWAPSMAKICLTLCRLSPVWPRHAILMSDGELKPIEQIERGDQVAGDPQLARHYTVARVFKQIINDRTRLSLVKFRPDHSAPDPFG